MTTNNGEEKSCSEEKSRLRRHYLSLRNGLDCALRRKYSREAGRLIYEWTQNQWRKTGGGPLSVVALYAAMKKEVDLENLAKTLREHGIVTVYPRCLGKRVMTFYRVTEESSLSPSAYGVPEPAAEEKTRVEPSAIDLMLIPGVAFSRKGLRLGYGGGFYDRYLAQPFVSALRIGVGYEMQMAPYLPRESFDCLMNYIVTEKEIYSCK